MVRPDKLRHDVINFREMRHVDVPTQNPFQVGDSFIRPSKSRELVRFQPQIAVHLIKIISLDEFG